MDNNYAEQSIRPFTIARKDFVLINLSKGATASAMLFRLAETAKANGIKHLPILWTSAYRNPKAHEG